MDPLAQALQLLQEAHDTIAILTEELANKSQGKTSDGKEEKKEEKKEETQQMQKQASEESIASVFGIAPEELPEFAKYASIEDARILRSAIEQELSYGSLGKTAAIGDSFGSDNPAEALNARLSNILG